MKNRGSIMLILMLFIAFFSCRKEAIDIQTNIDTQDPIAIPGYDPEVKMITADLFGRIVDENNNSIESAIIKVEGKTATTNEYGDFAFEDIQMNEYGTLVTASKEGFVLGSRLFYPKENDQVSVKIQLISEDAPEIIISDQGGTVKINGDVEINFESNSFVRLDGTEFIGDVYVNAKYLNPILPETVDEMPGALVGIIPTENNKEIALLPFGIVTVTLKTVDGQELNLASGAEAEVKFPIPEILLPLVPQEIAMAFFNEDIGRWVDEEVAYLEGKYFVGKVEHFTFWSCYINADLINLKIKVTDENGLPYANEKVVLYAIDLNILGSVWTNEEGILEGKVPANINLRAIITDNCDQILHNETLGPFTADTEIDLGLNLSNYQEIRLSGTLTCDGQAIDNALLVVDFEEVQRYYYISSPFEQSINICPEYAGQVSCTVFGLEGDTQSGSYPLVVEQDNPLGMINICDENSTDNPIVPNLDEYISVIYKGENTVFSDMDVQVVDFANPGYTRIRGQLDEMVVNVHFHGLTTGDYTGQSSSNGLAFAKNVVTMKDVNHKDEAGDLDNFEVTSFGSEGDYIVGSFAGDLRQRDTGNPYRIIGLFRVKVPETDYNGTYFELIASGYRYVRPELTGHVSLSTGNFGASTVELVGDASLVITLRDWLSSDFRIVHLFVMPEDMNVLIQSTTDESDAELTNFGEVGELVSGYSKGTYNDILSNEENSDYYLYYNIERLEDQ